MILRTEPSFTYHQPLPTIYSTQSLIHRINLQSYYTAHHQLKKKLHIQYLYKL